jgi:hypothetical protein
MSRLPGSTIVKDPQSVEPQGFDWTAYLAELGVGVIIDTSIWSVTGPDAVLTLSGDTVLVGGLKAKVYLTGGTPGQMYTVTNRIATNTVPAVQDDRSFDVLVENK